MQAKELFNRIDGDQSGNVDANELRGALKLLQLNVSTAQADKVVKALDQNGDGLLDVDEFIDSVFNGRLGRLRCVPLYWDPV